MDARAPITFEPAGITVWVELGTTVLEAARLAGIVLPAPCGGRGVCGACGVRVVSGELAAPSDHERTGLQNAPEGVRLACRARVAYPVTIRPFVVTRREVSGFMRTGECPPAVAGVDLGTTSVAAVLIDPETGRELGRGSVPNAQQSFGADVLTRISAALDGHAAELRGLADESVIAAVRAAVTAAGCDVRDVESLVIAGNSAMSALLAGSDVSSLARHPFTPPMYARDLPHDSSVRGAFGTCAEMIILPPIAGFVGGDALAATLSAGLIEAAEPVMLVDFGTNAEIVLAAKNRLIVTSAAAGPAFEGGGISCGGPAVDGAVTKVKIAEDGSIAVHSIGDSAPRWFSGSGLVSAVAELLRCGHIDSSGRLDSDGPLNARFATRGDGVVTVRLGEAEHDDLALTQLDVRALQLAKAAVRVGIEAVLHAGKIRAKKLDRLLIAGAFGTALEPQDLVDLGVIPERVALRTHKVGNAALDGAGAVALNPGILQLAEATSKDAVHVELALEPGFNKAFIAAMEFARYAG